MRNLDEQMDLFERIDPVEVPDLSVPPIDDALLAKSKEAVKTLPRDVGVGALTSIPVGAGDTVDLGSAFVPSYQDVVDGTTQGLMPSTSVLTLGTIFDTLSKAGVSRDNAEKLIKEVTGIELKGNPGEFIGEVIGLPAAALSNAGKSIISAVAKHGDKFDDVVTEAKSLFRTASGGDDFDGTAPATVTDTPPSVATQTDQAFDTAPKLPDTSVSPNMIGQETPYGRRAIADYKARKEYAENEGKPLTDEELFRQTNVYIGKDGKYRVALPVEEAKLVSYQDSAPYTITDKDGNQVDLMSERSGVRQNTVLDRLKEGDQISLSLLIDFPTLFDAYAEEFYDNVNLDFRTPEDIRNIQVTIRPVTDPNYYGGASYYRSSDEIEISSDLLKSPKTFMATLLHEVQHAVQNREGFVSGSNSRFLLGPAAEEISPGVASRIKSASDFDRRLAELKAKKDADYQQAFATLDKYVTDEGLALVDEDIVTIVDDYIEFLVRNLETGSYVELAEGIKAPNPKVYDKLDSYTMFDFIIDDNKLFEDFEKFSGLNFRESRDQAELISYDLNRFSQFNQAIRTSSPDVSFERKMFDIFKDVVRNEREQQYLNKVERLANLNYKRSFGEAESRLVEERYGLSKNLQAEGKSREEIRNALAERYPPQNYTVDLLTLMQADVDPIDAQRGLGDKYKEGVMSEIGIDQLEFVDEDFLRLDPKQADKSAAEKPIIQGANETGFSRAVFHSTGDAKNLRVPKMVPETPGADIGFHVGTTGSANDRIMLQSMARQASQTELDQAFAGKSIMPLRLSDDLKPARLIDLNAFKSPQNWVEELSDPFTSNTELGFFNIPIGTKMPSMTLYPNSKFERTVYMSPQAFAEGVNEDVWRSAILTAEKFLSRNVDTTKNIDDRREWFEAVKKIATDNGYDSFVYKNVKEGKGDDSYMLLDPRQVKSFTAKDFDPANPDITMAEGGVVPMDKQMNMFQDGGLEQDGGTKDPVSGNEVPPGSSQEEVRDDIPAQLSEGEFVFPADVVRYIGLEKLMRMRQEAKMGLKMMEEMGQMGNSDEATIPDDLPFGITDLIIVDGSEEVDSNDKKEYNTGGMVPEVGIPPGIPTPQEQVGNIRYNAPQTPASPSQIGMAADPVEMPPIERPQQQETPVFVPPQPLPTPENFLQPSNQQAPQTITIINQQTGEERVITFIPGVTEIPEGFVIKEDSKTTDVSSEGTTVKTATVRDDDDDSDERRRQEEEAKYGPGGGRVGLGGVSDGKGFKDDATIVGVSFDGGGPALAAALATGKGIPEDVNATFFLDGETVTVRAEVYNRMKEAGFEGDESNFILDRLKNPLEKRQREFAERRAKKMGEEAKQQAQIEGKRQNQLAKAQQMERDSEERKQAFGERDDTSRSLFTEGSIIDRAVRQAQDEEFMDIARESLGRRTAEDYSYDLNKGGIAAKKKPKAKKKMKRGGLASKK